MSLPMSTESAHGICRREMLRRAGTGFGALALYGMLADDARSSGDRGLNPLAPLPGHHPARARHCIFLYMPGGPSHVDLFDPKPRLEAESGKPLPFEKPKLELTKPGNLFPSPWKFAKHGECG